MQKYLHPSGSGSQSVLLYCNLFPHSPDRLHPCLLPLCKGGSSRLLTIHVTSRCLETDLLQKHSWTHCIWRGSELWTADVLGQGLYLFLCVCVDRIQAHPHEAIRILHRSLPSLIMITSHLKTSECGLKASLLGLETSCLQSSPPCSRNYHLSSLVSPISSHLPNTIPTHADVLKHASHPPHPYAHPYASDPRPLLDLYWILVLQPVFPSQDSYFRHKEKKKSSYKTVNWHDVFINWETR